MFVLKSYNTSKPKNVSSKALYSAVLVRLFGERRGQGSAAKSDITPLTFV